MSRHLHHTFLARCMSSSTSSKVPLLWKPDIDSATSISTLQLLSWGRGSSGQLGGGIEEIRLHPTPVASFNLPSNYRLSPTTGFLPEPSTDSSSFEKLSISEIGISCGFFHSSLLINGNLWMWGKGDGGRLGFGHENPAFSPTLNPNLDCVGSTALGGLHSVALTTLGDVYTWGYGGFGALGHSIYTRELLPRMVSKAWSGKICQIATSGAHTAA
ncbi:hypothetical protein MKW94_020593, partial [Papaver nudicaule]|nr:hypothetical protein [Papaver nudicaule]